VIPVILRGNAGSQSEQQAGRNEASAQEQAKLLTHDQILPSPGTARPGYFLGLDKIMKRVIFFAKRLPPIRGLRPALPLAPSDKRKNRAGSYLGGDNNGGRSLSGRAALPS
jgi:hypothetical protein